jgi:hypothetical protein
MTVTNTEYEGYRPTRLKVISLGVGISDETNDSLNLTGNQHLIVGETLLNTGAGTEKAYGLIVDKQGIAVNSTIPDRALQSNVYAAFIEGNVFVTGTLTACNVIGGSGGSGGSGATSNFWIQSTGDQDSIYFPGRITFGNRGNNTVARNNTHAMSIAESADRTIDHAQISVQNTQLAEFRVAVLGTSNISPAVVNTVPGVPLEFHAARGQDYFSNVYRRSYYEAGSNVTVPSEIPRYQTRASQPHMVIDTDGTVGVGIAAIGTITAEQATPVPTPTGVTFPVVTEKMALHVNGPAFASNLLIWDHQCNVPVNIDRLFVRRYGATFEAIQVLPGYFNNEPYVFPGQLAVNGPPSSGFDFTVTGRERVTDYLQVDGLTTVNRMEVNNAVLLDIASFCNDVYINRDVIIKESIRLRGGMYVEYPDGSNGVTWCNVQFQVANSGLCNINYFGLGISTPGRFGVGIDPNTDEVNNQLVVRKRSSDIYELELFDKSSPTLNKVAYIGHPTPAPERRDDASLVFCTPGPFDPDFNFRTNTRAPQNFYFYPASSFASRTEPIVNSNNPPTLNIESRKRVGVLTFDPLSAVDVRGDIAFSGRLIPIGLATGTGDSNVPAVITADTPNLGLWTEETFSAPLPSQGSNVTFRGLRYARSNVTSAAIHGTPDPRYGLAVNGGLRLDHAYGADDVLTSAWVAGPNADGTTPAGAGANSAARAGDAFDPAHPAQSGSMFTYKNVGIGVTNPGGADLTVRNTRLGAASPDADDTILRLYRSVPTTSRTRLEFGGVRDPWIILGNDADRRLEFGYSSNAFVTDATKRAMWMRYNTDTGAQQVIIGGDLNVFDVSRSNPDPTAPLIVDGNISVLGDVRIRGHYYMAGSLFVNSNLIPTYQLPANTDDVLIAGNIISVNPVTTTSAGVTTYGFMGVGYTAEALSIERTTTDKTPFRVYQADQEITTIGRFQATGQTALVDIVNRAGDKLRFGVTANNNFAFMDKNNNSFINFSTDPATSQRFFGVNTDISRPVTASIHIQNAGIGSNMLRLSRYGVGDTPNAAPELEMEKSIVVGAVNQTTRWIFHGPDQYQQKLSLMYGTGVATAASGSPDAPVRTELFTFTNTGCIGIGNTTPEYALDIVGSEKRGSLRLLNVGSTPSPQLIFQSDSNIYGVDASTDYRFYSSNNTFILDSENGTLGYKKLLHFGADGKVGVLASPDSRYAMNVGGSLNVRSTLFVDDNPVFTTEPDSGTTVFSIQATNIYLKPTTPVYGGVVVNGSQPTSNLFHIYSGSNATMTVYDSLHERAYLQFRAQQGGAGGGVFNRYAVGMSNRDFVVAYASNTGRASYVPTSADGGADIGMSRYVTVGPNPEATAAAAGYAQIRVAGDARLRDVALLTTPVTTPGSSGSCLTLSHASNVAEVHANAQSLATGAVVQVLGDDQTALSVTQIGSAALLQLRNVTVVGEEALRVVIDNIGYVGIGTTAPQAPLHIGVAYGAGALEVGARIDTGALQLPAIRFAGTSAGVRLETPTTDTLTVKTAMSERMRVDAYGNVGIGTDVSVARVQINAPTAAQGSAEPAIAGADALRVFGSNAPTAIAPALVVASDAWVGIGTGSAALPPLAAGSADPAGAWERSVFTVAGGNATFGGAVLPAATETYDLGSSNARWRDLFLSGSTMNLGGTKVSRSAVSGDVRIADDASDALRALVTASVTLGDAAPGAANATAVTFSVNPAYAPGLGQTPVLYSVYDTASATTAVFEPIFKTDDGSAVSIAALYVRETNSNPALLVDHTTGNSNAAIAQFRSDTTPVFTVFQSGAIGMGDAAASESALVTGLTVSYSNELSESAASPAVVTIAQLGGTGDLLRLASPTSNVADTRLIVTADGSVGIGTTAAMPDTRLGVVGNFVVAEGIATFGSNVSLTEGDLSVNGTIWNNGNVISTSDRRLKTDLVRIDGALDRIQTLTGYTYTRRHLDHDDPPTQPNVKGMRRETGLIAQDVAEILPEAVYINDDGYLSLAYGNLAGLIVEAIKELRSEIQEIREVVGLP